MTINNGDVDARLVRHRRRRHRAARGRARACAPRSGGRGAHRAREVERGMPAAPHRARRLLAGRRDRAADRACATPSAWRASWRSRPTCRSRTASTAEAQRRQRATCRSSWRTARRTRSSRSRSRDALARAARAARLPGGMARVPDAALGVRRRRSTTSAPGSAASSAEPRQKGANAPLSICRESGSGRVAHHVPAAQQLVVVPALGHPERQQHRAQAVVVEHEALSGGVYPGRK